MTKSELVHGTCVAIDNRGVLIVGPSGSGKSDLALRLIDAGALLVGDDYLEAKAIGQHLHVKAPVALQGKLEVRHIGICRFPFLAEIQIHLVVRLDGKPERLPQEISETYLGNALPLLHLSAFEASAPLKVRLALEQGVGVT